MSSSVRARLQPSCRSRGLSRRRSRGVSEAPTATQGDLVDLTAEPLHVVDTRLALVLPREREHFISHIKSINQPRPPAPPRAERSASIPPPDPDRASSRPRAGPRQRSGSSIPATPAVRCRTGRHALPDRRAHAPQHASLLLAQRARAATRRLRGAALARLTHGDVLGGGRVGVSDVLGDQGLRSLRRRTRALLCRRRGSTFCKMVDATQRIRTAAEIPAEAVITDNSDAPVYLRIAEKASTCGSWG